MAKVTRLQDLGNQMRLIYDDGTQAIAYPGTGSLWYVTNPGTTDPGGGGTGGTGGIVIYPTVQHTVVDFDGSFVGHQSRNPPSVNPGSDYAPLPIGSDVWAVADGVVTDTTPTNTGSGGRMVHIDHTALGTGSDYLHLSQILVSEGQNVKQGDLIAKSGASGFGSDNGYGAHLHISYRTVLGHAYTSFNSIDFDAYIKGLGIQ